MVNLRIYNGQINPTVGDIVGNTKLVLQQYNMACAQKADICVLPEAVLCGYTPQDLILRPQFIDDLQQATLDIVAKVENTALFLSVPWRDAIDGQIYNAVHFIHNRKIQQTIYKQCLPNFGVMDEKRVFTVGINNKTIPFKGINIGLLVCHDTWWPEVASTLKKAGADFFISINASPYELGKEDFRVGFCQDRV
ncbi:MAG: NAD+ synthase, partial [bacterium]